MIQKSKNIELASYSYFTEIKVDSLQNRVMQTIWTDESKKQQITKTLIDFRNRTLFDLVSDETGTLKCNKVQMGRMVRSIRQILHMFWTPAKGLVGYLGRQCIENYPDVFGFEGSNSLGEEWLAYFDANSGLLVKAYHGLGMEIDWQVEGVKPDAFVTLNVRKHTPFPMGFEELKLAECFDGSVEVKESKSGRPLIPTGDFGFFMY